MRLSRRLLPTKAAAPLAAFVAVLAFAAPVAAQEPTPPQPQTEGIVRVDSIAIEGNRRQTRDDILRVVNLTPGGNVTYRDVQRAVKDLWATGQFTDVRVRAVGQEGEPVVLVFDVAEQDLVRRLDIRGLEHLSAGTVRDTTGLQAGQPYSPARVAVAKAFIRSELEREGIPFAQIEERREPIPGREGEIALVLDVTEGQRVTVAEVDFEGNEYFAEDELRGAMETKPEGFWWFRPGSYEQSTFEQDLSERLPRFYSSEGFLDFQILSDTLVVDPETGKARVVVSVSEGPRYRMADFEIEGNSRFPTADLERYYRTEDGGLLANLGLRDEDEGLPVFDAVAFEDALTRVQELYSNEGYIYARVEPFVQKNEAEEAEPPTVSVGWRITEGQPAYVNRIAIEGNDFTYERVVREKIFLLPGDVFSRELLIQSYQNISSLGFFETPMEFPTVEPDPETGDVDITFHVTEKQTGSINFGTAVGGGTGVAGFLGYDQPNLFGQAKEGHLRWDFGRYQNNFTVSFSDPSLWQSRISGSVSLFNSRDRFFTFQSGERRRIGGTMRFGLPLPNSSRTRMFVGYGLSRTKYRLRDDVDDTSLFGTPPGTQSTLSLGIVRNTLNHPLFPTAGSRQSVNTEFNGGVLGGDGQFVKHSLEGTWWVPVGQVGGGDPGSRPIRFALGLSLRSGTVFGNADRFPFDRFWMGGVQFGQQLRGYDETSVTPLGFFPEGSRSVADIDRLGDAFLSLTAEYAIRFNDNLSVSAFYDAGNVWRDPLDIDPTRLFRGAGLGVQLVTPFGPLGLDYAYGFDKTNPGWQLHFRLGPGF